MGRSTNSFTAWSRPANAVEGRNQMPEEKLFTAVLSQAVHDVFKKSRPKNEDTLQQSKTYTLTQRIDRDAAKNFFLSNGPDLKIICELAGRDSQYVHEKMRKNILRENGWNVDESIGYLHKTYRRTYSTAASGKKRGRKHSLNGAKYGRPKKIVSL